MSWLDSHELDFLEATSRLAYANPFLPERIQLEKRALGSQFCEDTTRVWSRDAAWERERPNVTLLADKVEQVCGNLRARLADGAKASRRELELYENVVAYLLYYRIWDDLSDLITRPEQRTKVVKCWTSFQRDFHHFLVLPEQRMPGQHDAGHLLACFFQIRRAFHHIFDFVLGASAAAARLRAAIWQSIFTHNMQRYQRSLYAMMTDIPTLITGPSGTGKELVARAIGLSRYVPFDTESRSFVADYGEAFQPVHLAAMTPALIESELFGHCKGSFTGAVRDRAGRLEECPSCGSVFMDEVGEISMDIQVKLLRVLQSREFQRVGESQTRIFSGRIITATNRDLAAEATAGRFREDLYYRLCADTVTTPSLRDQLDDCPQDLTNLISFIAGRIAGDESESVTAEATAWIQQSLDPAYPWPGNIRELEQCVRNIMVHGEYRPAFAATRPGNSHEAITAGVDACSMTADELVQHYCSLLYARTGSYEKAAVVLQLDRRTVKAKVDKCRSAFGFDD